MPYYVSFFNFGQIKGGWGQIHDVILCYLILCLILLYYMYMHVLHQLLCKYGDFCIDSFFYTCKFMQNMCQYAAIQIYIYITLKIPFMYIKAKCQHEFLYLSAYLYFEEFVCTPKNICYGKKK